MPAPATASKIEERELSEHDFIGHVFTKASPILTWRPTKVQRITAKQLASDADDHRFSRAPTKRMVKLPLVSGVRHAPTRALRALGTLIAFSLLCGSALTLCVYVLLGDSSLLGGSSQTAHLKAPPVRAAVAHVADPHTDTLVAAPVVVALTEPAHSRVDAHRTAARSQRGPAPHAHRYQGAALHAGHAAHTTGSPSRRPT